MTESTKEAPRLFVEGLRFEQSRTAHGVCLLHGADHVAAPRGKRMPRVSGAASGAGPLSGIGVGDTPAGGATEGTPQLPEAQPPDPQLPVAHPPEHGEAGQTV